MPPARKFTDLIVWQKSHQFVLAVYDTTKRFPADERFGLTSQMRRAAVSIPANIAEGFRKRSNADKARFMNIAEGSLDECRYYIMLADDLGYQIARDAMLAAADEIARLLHSYAAKLRA